MRLTLKLTLVLSFVVAGGVAAQSVIHVQRVRALHIAEARDDLEILTRALAFASSQIWSSEGEIEARSYIEKADARRARTRIRIVGRDVGPVELTADPSPTEVRADSLVAYGAVVVGGAPVARIELVRSRQAEREFTHDLLIRQVATIVAVVGACAVLALVLGLWLVGRPVQNLISHARRVALGDFSAMAPASSRDELGRLAQEMNMMTEHLARSEERTRAERRRRAQIAEQLRHADRLSTAGKLASGIAHELGTPLNVVSGRASMIASDAEASERIRASAKTIAEQAERMTSIVRQLLGFSRSDLQRASMGLREVIDSAVTLVEPLAEEQHVVVEVGEVADSRATLDAGRTLQVLSNLIVNAIQAMPDGGTVHLSAHRREVSSPSDKHAAPGEYVCFAVRDEGSGISVEDLDRVFEPFFTTKDAGEGTGLGLSVSHGIVREHGGWIEVDSEPGRGSCFRVYLPIGGTA